MKIKSITLIKKIKVQTVKRRGGGRQAKKVVYEDGKSDGEKIGLRKGIEKGIEKGKAEMAKKALEEGLPIDLVSKISGLTIEEVEKL